MSTSNIASHTLQCIYDIACTENEKVVVDYIVDCSDAIGFDGSMKDISDIMDIPIKDVLKFHNKIYEHKLLLRVSPNRHTFI